MAFTKTERVRLRVTEDMAREIRAIAELEHRQVQDQIRFLIAMGLEQRRRGTEKERDAESRPTLSHAVPSTRTSEAQAKGQMSLPGTVGPIPAKKRRVA
jgi:hypothetical protein